VDSDVEAAPKKFGVAVKPLLSSSHGCDGDKTFKERELSVTGRQVGMQLLKL
jgi:hypothetical protein